ncbi:MAG TPA: cadherin-like beta sandwich domain-containing protein [Polyangiales bacterium]|nr:cadherin-like beta sandwich domain-containing protein [Polyangiales bacterium]
MGRGVRYAAVIVLFGAAAAACTEPLTRTRLEATIDADIPVREQVVDVEARIEVSTSGAAWKILTAVHLLPESSDDWPLKFKTDALSEIEGATYQLIAQANDSRAAVLAQARVLADFDDARNNALNVLFDQRCAGRDELCVAGLTCREGDCVSAVYNPAARHRPPATAPLPDTERTDPRSIAANTKGVAEESTPCSTEGERRCAGFGSSIPLRCESGSWKRQLECNAMQHCDSSEGAQQGTCQQIAPECAGKRPDEPFCRDEIMRVCDVDLLAAKTRPCPDTKRCATDASGEAHCVCQPGSVEGTVGCEAAKSCARDNGGCDPLTVCTDGANGRTCGLCPAGFGGTGDSGCVPRLKALETSAGVLSPAFSPEITEYRVQVPLLVQRITLSVQTPDAAMVSFNGTAAGESLRWTSPVLALGDNLLEVRAQTKFGVGTAYRIHIERAGKQAAYIKPSTTKAAMYFGAWMALSGDTLVVAAPFENSAATGINGDEKSTAVKDAGAAYVFVRTPNGWMQQAFVKSPKETNPGDFFGSSVAISGDTMAIGAVRRDLRNPLASISRIGVVYVYTRSAGVWTLQQELSANDATIGDSFGYSLALDGDTLAVGLPIVGQLGSKYGAVYTFNRTGGMWQQSSKLVSPHPDDLGQFGSFLSLAGDTLVVSAQEDSNKADRGGAVYLFTRRDAGWGTPQRLEPDPPRANAWFGFETAVLGDRLAVGAPSVDDPDRTDEKQGEVWMYERRADRWENTTVLRAPLAQAGNLYGTGVALGADSLLISAPGENGGSKGVGGDPNRRDGAQTGAAYLYAYTDEGWKLSTYFKANNPGAGDSYGWMLALGSDFAVVAAPKEDGAGSGIDAADSNSSGDSGAIYVFE